MNEQHQNNETTYTRRDFLAKTGRTTAAVGIGIAAANTLNLQPVFGQAETKPRNSPNDRLRLGLIACGGMGSANMHNLMGRNGVEVTALCDVDESRMGGDIKAVEEKYGKRPALYKDYRKLLDDKNVDAVIIGTPDHWHALNLIHACEAGKDSYCEKPVSHNIVEANAMTAAAKRFNRVVQVGTWQRSTREFTDAVAYVRSGKLGKITTVRAWKTDGARVGRHAPKPVPAGFDYDMWIGPARFTDYVPEHTHGNWRWFLNTGCGMTGDWGVHMMDIGLLGMSKTTDLVMPTEVAAYGGKLAWPDDDRTAPDTHLALFRFPKEGFVMHWETGRRPPQAGAPDNGTEFIAEDGKTLMVWRGGWKVTDAGGKELPKEGAEPVGDHWQNWLDCVRTREQPRSNLASMAQTTIVCHLANAALLAGETVHWDKAKMDIVGGAGKNTIAYRREYRKGYKLPVYKV
jgi:predicted dehydrogenase